MQKINQSTQKIKYSYLQFVKVERKKKQKQQSACEYTVMPTTTVKLPPGKC